MSDFLALKWEKQQLIGVEASLGRGKVRIDRCLLLEWPEGMKPTDQAQLAGNFLKGELQRLGVTARQVLVSLPREEAIVRPLDLPDAPDNELPDLVRLQAATKSTAPLDRLLLDYLPRPRQPGTVGRSVLMATISRQLADLIRGVVEAADLELVSIGIGAAATAELVVREELRQGEETEGERLVIVRRGKQVELSILSRRNLVFTHTTRLTESTTEQQNHAILAEVSRSVVALQRTIPNVRIARAWVLGSAEENPHLAEALAQRLSCDVRGAFDPLSAADVELSTADIPGGRGSYASAVGLLLARLGKSVEAVDFLDPRKPVVQRGSERRRMAIAGIGLALIAVAAGRWYWSAVSGRQSEIQHLLDQAKKLTDYKKEREEFLKTAKLLGEWDKRNVPWLDPAQKIREALGGPDRIYLEELHFAAGAAGQLGNLTISGFAKERADSEALDRKLVERKFTVKPHKVNVESKDSEYPYRVAVDLELVERTPSRATP